MVIRMTMIVATYMNAVSPLLTLGGFGASAGLASAGLASAAFASAAFGASAFASAAAGAAAGVAAGAASAFGASALAGSIFMPSPCVGAPCAKAVEVSAPNASAPAARNVSKCFFIFILIVLERFLAGLAGSDANDLLEVIDEDLAVADLAGTCRGLDRLDRTLGHV